MISFGIAAVVVAHHEDKIIAGEWESIFQWAFSWQSTNILALFIYLYYCIIYCQCILIKIILMALYLYFGLIFCTSA